MPTLNLASSTINNTCLPTTTIVNHTPALPLTTVKWPPPAVIITTHYRHHTAPRQLTPTTMRWQCHITSAQRLNECSLVDGSW
jgi:hypothetical protein